MPARLLFCEQADKRLAELRSYYSSALEKTWLNLIERIFEAFDMIAEHNFIGENIPGLPEVYRKWNIYPFGRRRSTSTTSYVIYYRVDKIANTVRIIDIRGGSQKPLQPKTVKRYSQKVTGEEIEDR